VVTGAKGFVFLAGNTATTDDYEPFKKGGSVKNHKAIQRHGAVPYIAFKSRRAEGLWKKMFH